jgi:hypothetical protein
MTRRLVGLSGYAGVGKDALQSALGFNRCAFADALKADLAPLLAKLPPHTKTQIRPLLVEYGRTARRIDPDYWVKRAVVPDGDVAFTDCRYRNETKFILSLGGIIIRVHRPGVGPANEEEERTIAEIDATWKFPSVVNDGTPADAAGKVLEILNARS